jgi:hypothetical protein
MIGVIAAPRSIDIFFVAKLQETGNGKGSKKTTVARDSKTYTTQKGNMRESG